MNDSPAQIEATIAALEAQRALLGDAVVDSAIAPLKRELAAHAAAAAVPRQQLRQVSVLFIDVVGSTAMGQRLQPEDIQSVLDGALQRFTEVVLTHRGRVLQYTGDGMLAAFGADSAGEDDPECAVLAALGIIAVSREEAERARDALGIPDFNVRAGIHTGTVLLGGGVDAEGSIRGAVVNIAARMEQSAPAGGVRISHDTYRHVRGLFDMEEQPLLAVKGFDAPFRNHLVRGPRPKEMQETPRGIEGVRVDLVGRDAEFQILQGAFTEVSTESSLRAVTVLGDAGLGKSRLTEEFCRLLTSEPVRCQVLFGRAYPRSAMQPFGLLRDMVGRHLHISEADSPDVARAKLVDGMAPLFKVEGEAPIHLLGHVIGLDFANSPHVNERLNDAGALRAGAFEALNLYLERLAAHTGTPVAVVLDDLHWSDAGSLDFAEYLLAHGREAPLFVLMLSRPDLIDQRPQWAEQGSAHRLVELVPLDAERSERLTDSLLQRIADIPAALRALITSGAEGNPFYMEELVKLLIDDGVIVTSDDGWQVANDRLLRVRVPPTLTGVLQVRVDALTVPQRTALQHAAVIGQVFSDQALAAVDATAPASLDALLQRHLIVALQAPATDGGSGYSFQHNLLYQVTYDTILKGPKLAGHAKVGAYWSERAAVGSPQEVTPARSRALVEAHYHRTLSDPKAYIEWFEAQFGHYLKAWASHTLRPLAEAMIELCTQHFGVDGPPTARALTNLARTLMQLGETHEAEPLLRRAIDIQERDPGPDHPDTARTLAVLGAYFASRGDHHSAEPLLRRALSIRETALGAEHALTVAALDLLAASVSELGRDEAESLARRVLDIRERLCGPDHPDTCLALTSLGDILSKKHDHAAAEPLIRRALAGQRKNLPAEHPDTGLSMWSLAEALSGMGRLEDAEPLARGSLTMWEKTLGPQHEWTAWSLSSLAKLRLAQGDAADAATLVRRAIEIHVRELGPEHETVRENRGVLEEALRQLAAAHGPTSTQQLHCANGSTP